MKKSYYNLIAFACISASFSQGISEDSLVSHLTFDNQIEDRKIPTANILVKGNPVFSKGAKGINNTALSFDGIDDVIEISNWGNSFNVPQDGSYTLAAVCKFENERNDQIAQIWSKYGCPHGNISDNIGIAIKENMLAFASRPTTVFGSGTVNGLYEINKNTKKSKFISLILIRRVQETTAFLEVYIDGIKIFNQSLSTDLRKAINSSVPRIVIGAGYACESGGVRGNLVSQLKGSIDDLRFYKRALTEEEIKIHKNLACEDLVNLKPIIGNLNPCPGEQIYRVNKYGKLFWSVNDSSATVESNDSLGYVNFKKSGTFNLAVFQKNECFVNYADTTVTVKNGPTMPTLFINSQGKLGTTPQSGVTYQWKENGVVKGGTSAIFADSLKNATYTLTVSSGGCNATSYPFNVYVAKDQTTNLIGGRLNVSVEVFPNPTQNIIHLKDNGNNITKVEVLNIQGLLVHTESNPSESLNIGHLKSGVYLLSVYDESGNRIHLQQIVKY
ncbi:MAG: T9SS type A sorting domain-containing protein [Cytophagales bacterium]